MQLVVTKTRMNKTSSHTRSSDQKYFWFGTEKTFFYKMAPLSTILKEVQKSQRSVPKPKITNSPILRNLSSGQTMQERAENGTLPSIQFYYHKSRNRQLAWEFYLGSLKQRRGIVKIEEDKLASMHGKNKCNDEKQFVDLHQVDQAKIQSKVSESEDDDDGSDTEEDDAEDIESDHNHHEVADVDDIEEDDGPDDDNDDDNDGANVDADEDDEEKMNNDNMNNFVDGGNGNGGGEDGDDDNDDLFADLVGDGGGGDSVDEFGGFRKKDAATCTEETEEDEEAEDEEPTISSSAFTEKEF